MATYKIVIMNVEAGVDSEGDPCRYVTFKVKKWPEFGPWTIPIPLTYTKPQAKAAIEAFVEDLASNTHEWYGHEWSMTV